MKFKQKLLTSILALSIMIFANCGKSINNGSDVNGLIFANYVGGLIKSATSGNCAISLNLGTLYAGSILQGAAANATNFTQAQYESVTGSTIAAQGYATYAVVPFNKKYDAFLRTAGTWTEALRNTALANQKAQVDSAALVANASLLLNAANAVTPALTTTGAAFTAFYNTFTPAEKTAMATFNAANNGVTGISAVSGGTVNTLALLDAAVAGYPGNFANAGSWNAMATNFGGIVTIAPAGASRQAWRSGVGLLACTRIPRSSCSLGAVSTGSRSADVNSAVGTHNTLFENPDCRKTTAGFSNLLLVQTLVGLPKEVSTGNLNGRLPFVNSSLEVTGASEGSTTNFQFNKILAEGAYPKVNALQNISQQFTSAFPMRTGNTAYPVTTGSAVATSQTAQSEATAVAGSIPWIGGSNINLTTVESCEGLGLGAVGPTPIRISEQTTVLAGNAANANKRVLTPVNEIVYSFSANGTAAAEYATVTGNNNDSVYCNKSLRAKTPIPAALGTGTKLPEIFVSSGDGNATSLLTACAYGGTTGLLGSRAIVANVFATNLPGLFECPAAAQSGAATFGELGISGFSTFPNGRE